MQYRADIQGIRAVAVMAVIAFHANSAVLPGGFVGVDMFFVVSGYLMTSILLNSPLHLFDEIKKFYIGRMKRILPAYFLTLLVTSLIAMTIFVPADFAIYCRTLYHALFFLSNQFFSTFYDYFAPASHELPLLHTWSLAIEMQYYAFLPFLFFLTRKFLSKTFFVAIIFLLTAYVTMNIMHGHKQLEYFSLVARIPEFVVGGLVSMCAGGGEAFLKIS